MFVNHVFSNGRRRAIQPLAELLLQQSKQCGEKFVGVVFRSQPAQIVQPVAEQSRDLPLSSQARIVRQAVRALAPHKRRKPGHYWQPLQREKRRPCHKRRAGWRERAEFFFDGQDVLWRRWIFHTGSFGGGDVGRRGHSGGTDRELHGWLCERVVIPVIGIEKRKGKLRQFMHVRILRRDDFFKRFGAFQAKRTAGLHL